MPFSMGPTETLNMVIVSPVLTPAFTGTILEPALAFKTPRAASVDSSSPTSVLEE